MKENDTYLTVKDHSVSGEIFNLKLNKTYGYLETSPLPSEDKLPQYYKTEDYISHTDTQRNLFEKAYHVVRKVALKQKLKLIDALSTSEKNLLDFGCGTGDFLKVAQNYNWNIFGIEPNEQARAIANQKTNNAVFETIDSARFKNKSFDVISLWHVLEHLPNLQNQISVFKKLLKTDGVLIIAVPNHKSFDAKYYKNFWAAFDVPRHLWHFNQEAMKSLFASEKMCVVKTLPMKYDAYYVSLLSEKYKKGIMNPFKAFWIGFQSNLKAKSSGEYSSLIYVIKNC
ncbi:class I SAM-dependent methyltransferase [Lacinutrix iliipiscaria]|uniref:Class I SAM-dependent methyltransferase n=1 Tax=Lacinutrix iliipiscaria TaxID=1230532 RepID=A0ABW5WKY9_9FLAO